MTFEPMRESARSVSEKELRRDYPIQGLVPGWFFCQREVSAGCWVVAGRDIYGREVSIQAVDADAALEECVGYARGVST